MANIMKKIAEYVVADYEFEPYEDGVVKVKGLNGVYVFVEYFEEDDTFLVFDGSFTIVECLENFEENDELVEKIRKILTKYKVSKDEDSLFIECKGQDLSGCIQNLIDAENEILYK